MLDSRARARARGGIPVVEDDAVAMPVQVFSSS